jgi:hypothetical protein
MVAGGAEVDWATAATASPLALILSLSTYIATLSEIAKIHIAPIRMLAHILKFLKVLAQSSPGSVMQIRRSSMALS